MSRPGPRSTARWLGLLGLCLSVACERGNASEKATKASAPSEAETRALRAALTTYADIAHAGYSDAALGVRALLGSVDAFLAAPSAVGLELARKAWLASRKPYQQTEVLRFYDGPIDRLEMRINSWPIDEGYVDGTVLHGKLGIIEDARRYPELSTTLLGELNAKEGETSISTGYHVIEFLLWGADTHAEGPGQRPFTDYVGKDGEPALRRARFLRLAVELLAQDVETVRDEWAPNRPGNYRAQFLALPPTAAFGLAIKGMGSLSGPELAGERLTVAYETKSQENEHSCFSDSTVNDLADNALGIQNMCLGRYEPSAGPAVRGPGLCDAIATRDRALAERLRTGIAASLEKVRAIPSPFDQAMLGDDAAPGRIAILSAARSLEAQTSVLAEVAAAYDVRITSVAARKRP